ncbi:MAG: TonB-dependent receptor plug domain-containing protein, partial [Bacteroidota bacterium]
LQFFQQDQVREYDNHVNNFLCIALFTILSLVFIFSCSSNKDLVSDGSTGTGNAQGELNNLDYAVDLTTHLMRISGLNVRGSGADAVITVRGSESNTFSASSIRGAEDDDPQTAYGSGGGEPLFIFNDIQVNSYAELYNIVTPDDIKSIRVLKGPEASAYGARAFNGVIVIKSK